MTDVTYDNITVTELPDVASPSSPGGDVLGSVLGVYEQHGYDVGYGRAVRDVLLSLLVVTEDFIRQRGLPESAAADLRQVVWAYHAHLQQRSDALPGNSAAAYVDGGLGI